MNYVLKIFQVPNVKLYFFKYTSIFIILNYLQEPIKPFIQNLKSISGKKCFLIDLKKYTHIFIIFTGAQNS